MVALVKSKVRGCVKNSGSRCVSRLTKMAGSQRCDTRSRIFGQCRRFRAGVVWFLGIVDCAVGANHDPKPFAFGRPLPGAAEFLRGLGCCSSGPVLIMGTGESIVVANPTGALLWGTTWIGTGVPVLTPGVAMALVLWMVAFAKPLCSRALISPSCSKMSLSPASNLMPGSL